MTTATAPAPAVRSIPDEVPPPNRTLVRPIAEWVTNNLVHPDGDRPFTFTREQLRILARWYGIDEQGRFVNRRGAIRRMRGWGKSPFLAVLCVVEFLGPCRFGGWNADGTAQAVPVRNPWIQLAAVNMEQTRAVMDLVGELFNDECRAYYGLDIGKEVVYRTGPGKLQTVTNSPRALRGARPTFYCLDETSEWVSGNGGHAMMERIRGNLAKSRDGAARALEICNAFIPGEDSVAERTYEAWVKSQVGDTRMNDLYYDSVEAPPDTDLADADSLRHGLECARGDSDWIDVDRFMAEAWDPATSPSLTRRDYLNQIMAAEDALVPTHVWDACAHPDATLADGDVITMGFDGSKSEDSTALVACRVSDRTMFVLGLAEKDPLDPNWVVDAEYFDGLVAHAFATYTVVGFFSDYHPFETYVDSWAHKYRETVQVKASTKSAVALDMRHNHKMLSVGVERILDAIANKDVSHNGDVRLRAHVTNARRRFTSHGLLSFGKEARESQRKVDLVAGMVLADLARHEFLASGKGARPARGMVRLR